MTQYSRLKRVAASVLLVVAAVAVLVETSSWLSLGGGLTFAEADQQIIDPYENTPWYLTGVTPILLESLATFVVANGIYYIIVFVLHPQR